MIYIEYKNKMRLKKYIYNVMELLICFSLLFCFVLKSTKGIMITSYLMFIIIIIIIIFIFL